MIPTNLLLHYLNLMRARGFLDGDVLRGTSIAQSVFDDPGSRIAPAEYQTIVGNMLRLVGDRGLGFEIGRHSEIHHLGTFGYAVISCPSMRKSIDIWKQFGTDYGFTWENDTSCDTDQFHTLNIFDARRELADCRFTTEAALTFFLRAGALATGIEPELKLLQFSYPEPIYSNRYHDVFRCPISFNAEQTCVTIKSSWIDWPLKTHDEEFNKICRSYLNQILQQNGNDSSIAGKLRALLMQRQDNAFSLHRLAADVGIGPRSLERQLNKEGYTYRQLLEEVRVQLAQEWLRFDKTISAKQISYRLGFSDVNAFRRAFKGWTGQTIQEYRSTCLVKEEGTTLRQATRYQKQKQSPRGAGN